MDVSANEIFDIAALRRNFADDMEFAARLLTKFEGRYPAQLENVRAALARGDGAVAAEAAHRLAGEAGVFYSVAARQEALRLEDLARAGDLPSAGAALARLRAELDRLTAALRELPTGGGTG